MTESMTQPSPEPLTEPLTEQQHWQRLYAQIPAQLPERTMFAARLKRYLPDILAALAVVYPQQLESTLDALLAVMLTAYQARSSSLKALDLERMLNPDWFLRPEMIGYVCYTERFANTLQGVRGRLDYLEGLGVKYLHLMPLLKPRPAPHDGGYAVEDYRQVRPDLGDMADLEALAADLQARGMSLCLDLVLNHVAAEHQWAERARNGEAKYQRYFYLYPDRTIPDQYEQSLPEVFPDFAPGNFSYSPEAEQWVWTTFNTWQWDLNWSNPDVLVEFADVILWLANKGVSIFRLDAIAFIWKKLGSNCQNLPEVHSLTQVLRAVARIVAPSVIFKAEAIVAPPDLIHYLGRGAHYGKLSDLAYHNSLMVQLWSSLASRDSRLMTQALANFPLEPSNTGWGMYLRCHDDIGWAIDDGDAAAVGLDGALHRRFLSDFYAGQFPGSFARGLVFQENPRTGDRRISGSAAALAGLELAEERGDDLAVQMALERLLLAHAVILAWGGVPLLYMGDELALGNDYGFRQQPEHAPDNRWVHRPLMDWARLAHAEAEPSSIEGRMLTRLRHLLRVRCQTPQLHAATKSRVLAVENSHIFGFVREHPLGALVGLFNFSEHSQGFPYARLLELGIRRPFDHLSGQLLFIEDGLLRLPTLGRYWITEEA
jgi:amylosucrase